MYWVTLCVSILFKEIVGNSCSEYRYLALEYVLVFFFFKKLEFPNYTFLR